MAPSRRRRPISKIGSCFGMYTGLGRLDEAIPADASVDAPPPDAPTDTGNIGTGNIVTGEQSSIGSTEDYASSQQQQQ
eukprot:6584724-Prymnesium_polylepis.1